ncbi:MAG: hypothetical protein WCC73_10050 [Terracidiphilus sp.]
MIVAHKAFPLSKHQTKLTDNDYTFLRRFLNATKANLFFARGLRVPAQGWSWTQAHVFSTGLLGDCLRSADRHSMESIAPGVRFG